MYHSFQLIHKHLSGPHWCYLCTCSAILYNGTEGNQSAGTVHFVCHLLWLNYFNCIFSWIFRNCACFREGTCFPQIIEGISFKVF
jgi:hypothetical protein